MWSRIVTTMFICTFIFGISSAFAAGGVMEFAKERADFKYTGEMKPGKDSEKYANYIERMSGTVYVILGSNSIFYAVELYNGNRFTGGHFAAKVSLLDKNGDSLITSRFSDTLHAGLYGTNKRVIPYTMKDVDADTLNKIDSMSVDLVVDKIGEINDLEGNKLEDTINKFAQGVDVYYPKNPVKTLMRVSTYKYTDRAYGYMYLAEDGTGKKFVRLLFSNGTTGDADFNFSLVCVTKDKEVVWNLRDHQYLGTSRHGAVERTRDYIAKCRAPNMLATNWGRMDSNYKTGDVIPYIAAAVILGAGGTVTYVHAP